MTKNELYQLLKDREIEPTDREMEILTLRCGLDRDGTPRTREEVGALLGVSGTRIQIAEHAMVRRARYLRNRKKIADFCK